MFRTIFNTQRKAMAGSSRRAEEWRAAAHMVWLRWETFLDAPRDMRARAFAAYVAALDAEAAAAAEFADLVTVRV